jgi:hypothetical protein
VIFEVNPHEQAPMPEPKPFLFANFSTLSIYTCRDKRWWHQVNIIVRHSATSADVKAQSPCKGLDGIAAPIQQDGWLQEASSRFGVGVILIPSFLSFFLLLLLYAALKFAALAYIDPIPRPLAVTS